MTTWTTLPDGTNLNEFFRLEPAGAGVWNLKSSEHEFLSTLHVHTVAEAKRVADALLDSHGGGVLEV